MAVSYEFDHVIWKRFPVILLCYRLEGLLDSEMTEYTVYMRDQEGSEGSAVSANCDIGDAEPVLRFRGFLVQKAGLGVYVVQRRAVREFDSSRELLVMLVSFLDSVNVCRYREVGTLGL